MAKKAGLVKPRLQEGIVLETAYLDWVPFVSCPLAPQTLRTDLDFLDWDTLPSLTKDDLVSILDNFFENHFDTRLPKNFDVCYQVGPHVVVVSSGKDLHNVLRNGIKNFWIKYVPSYDSDSDEESSDSEDDEGLIDFLV